MQPWLDFHPRETTGCRRCGAALGPDVHVWSCRERVRRFDFEAPRVAGARALIRYDELSRAYPVCGRCHAALERGGHMGGAAVHRLAWLLAALVLACAAGAVLTPRLAPGFIHAFYRDGSMGR